ncbi:hypothetical protein [Methyloceanibacter sp.]|uniref:hypothetical protein n=1 Tax=Methyloceanibacter sp. TaxID=1965321 RepID=UPI002D52A7C5|nr:hypothetical protein [Methyloceanibacter sp.]HZP10279.1 hypothetical protein [Methyloceanibacter sp.]
MRHYLSALRGIKYLALTAASTLATAGLILGNVRPAHAEFEIQEATIEKGEVQVEYRGAVHWGVPKADKEGGAGNNESQAVDFDQEEAPVRQSNELELQYSVTDWWMVSLFTLGADKPDGEDFNVDSIEFETQFQLLKRHGDGIALAVQGGYEKAINHGRQQNADGIAFGPIVELASKKVLITLNPLFTDQVGPNRDTDGLGFEYGWRAEYDLAKHWGIGVEMFGEIDDLSHSGPWDAQNHSIGPTLFWNPGSDDEEEAKNGSDDDQVAGAPHMELSFNVGVQFGLTDATSDGALKFQGELSW